MKYILIETWNGEGYSYLNTNHEVFNTAKDAYNRLKLHAIESYEANKNYEYESSYIYGSDALSHFVYTTGFNSGSYQIFEIEDNAFGYVVLTNLNEVHIIDTEDDYNKELLYVTNKLIELDRSEDLTTDDNPFFPCIDGEYNDCDIQFVKIKH